jgi:hypothetical protein
MDKLSSGWCCPRTRPNQNIAIGEILYALSAVKLCAIDFALVLFFGCDSFPIPPTLTDGLDLNRPPTNGLGVVVFLFIELIA